MPFTWWEYKLWLDLQGWVELDYKVDLDTVKNDAGYNLSKENSIIEWLKSIIDKRIEALNISDSVITTSSYGGEKHIIVQIPLKWENREQNDLNIKRAKEAIWRVMKIEFKEKRLQVTQSDLDERKKISADLLTDLKASKYDFFVDATKFKDTYENIETWTMTWKLDELKKYFSLNESSIKDWLFNEIMTWTWLMSYTLDNWQLKQSSPSWYWIINVNSFKNNVLDFDYAFVWANPSEWKPAMDKEWRILNDKYFVNSSVQYSQSFQPMVELTFNDEWAKIFAELTWRLKGQPIAIFVWWNLLTAPTVNDTIPNGKAVITWTYTPEEAKKLSQDINTWVVPAPIYLTSEKTIDSKLWAHSLNELIVAWFWGLVLIFVFLIVVYRSVWFTAWVALVIYTLLTLTVVKALWITLTLASIAGLILSVWMAIDANILIFERFKDEIRQWIKMKKAVKEWFDRSWTAIWDSHVTWIIISLILFIFWVNMIKWFWLMLWIWLLLSLFSAMFISRVFMLLQTRKEDVNMNFLIGKIK
jgi:protein-export membrane protein SecD